MTYTELQTGEIYYCDWGGDGNIKSNYVMRKEEGNGAASHMMPVMLSFSFRSGGFYGGGNKFREATYKEKEHFLQCEKAGKYVEYKPEKIETLIFN